MQFEIEDTKYISPTTAATLCREFLGMQIPSNILDHISPMLSVMGKPKRPSKGKTREQVVVQVQFGHYRDAVMKRNAEAVMPASKEKVMADTIKNLIAKIDRVQEESDKRAEALASALQIIERLQCTR